MDREPSRGRPCLSAITRDGKRHACAYLLLHGGQDPAWHVCACRKPERWRDDLELDRIMGVTL